MSSPQTIEFAVYDPTTGVPKTGLTPSFDAYKDETGTNLTQPTITEVGSGFYGFTPTFTPAHLVCYIVNTNGGDPGHLSSWLRPEDFGPYTGVPSPQVIVFAVYDPTTGVPKTGVSCVFSTYEDDLGSPRTPPSITEIGGGLYSFAPTIPSGRLIQYVVSTAGNSPSHWSGSLRAEDFVVGPGFVVSGITPAPTQLTLSFGANYAVDTLVGGVTVAANWTISGAPPSLVTGVTKVGNSIVLTTTAQLNGASYTLSIPTGITANGGTQGLLGPYSLPFTGSGATPVIGIARSVDARTLDVVFNSPPTLASALQASNYTAAGLTITAVQEMTTVWFRLTTSKQAIDQAYTVTYSGT